MKTVTFPLRVRDRAFAFAASVCRKRGLKPPRGFDPVNQVVSVKPNPSGSDYEKAFREAVWQYLSENLGHGSLPEEVRRQVLGNPVRLPSPQAGAAPGSLAKSQAYATAVGSIAKLLFDAAYKINRNENPASYRSLVMIQGKGLPELGRAYKNQYADIAARSIATAMLNWLLEFSNADLLAAAELAGLPSKEEAWTDAVQLGRINSAEMRQRVADEIFKQMTTRLRAVTRFGSEQGLL